MSKPRFVTYRKFLILLKYFSIVDIVVRIGGLNQVILSDGIHDDIKVEFKN